MKNVTYVDWRYFSIWRGCSTGAVWFEFGSNGWLALGFGPGLSFVYACGDTWWEIGGNG